jgi:hypothetical protein
MLNYEGRRFRSIDPDTFSPIDGPGGTYHQDGSVVWAEIGDGAMVRGSLVGTCGEDGVLRLAYCALLTDGRVIAGRVRSVPTVLEDGRIRLHEDYERFGDDNESGVSVIEEHRDLQ